MPAAYSAATQFLGILSFFGNLEKVLLFWPLIKLNLFSVAGRSGRYMFRVLKNFGLNVFLKTLG